MPNPAEPRFPTHVAIIVDGNRRWAKQRLLPVSMGHKAGFDRLREITRYAVGDRGVFVLSLYVFSTENFSRDAKEVGYLMDLFANNFRTIADEMNERGCKVLFSGRREGLQQRVLDAMDYMMDLTKDNEKGIVLEGLKLKAVTIGQDGYTLDDVLVHDAHEKDNTLHMMLAMMGEDMPIALGVIRDVDAPVYDEAVHQQIEEVQAKNPIRNLQDYLMSGEIWEVK